MVCGHGGIGRLGGFRFHCQKRAGSSPVARTKAGGDFLAKIAACLVLFSLPFSLFSFLSPHRPPAMRWLPCVGGAVMAQAMTEGGVRCRYAKGHHSIVPTRLLPYTPSVPRKRGPPPPTRREAFSLFRQPLRRFLLLRYCRLAHRGMPPLLHAITNCVPPLIRSGVAGPPSPRGRHPSEVWGRLHRVNGFPV